MQKLRLVVSTYFFIFFITFTTLFIQPATAILSTSSVTVKQVDKIRQFEHASDEIYTALKAKKNSSKTTNILSAKSNNTAQKVMNAYYQWAGTRYKLGGTNRAGIDCSAFVRAAMQSAFNLNLPRTTTEQKNLGKAVSKSDLRPGDLVFFRNNHHVGIYVGNDKFVHSGSSTGVTIASLSSGYWARNYTQSRRIF